MTLERRSWGFRRNDVLNKEFPIADFPLASAGYFRLAL
jgi:hypothetical protein